VSPIEEEGNNIDQHGLTEEDRAQLTTSSEFMEMIKEEATSKSPAQYDVNYYLGLELKQEDAEKVANGMWIFSKEIERLEKKIHAKTISKEHAVIARKKAEAELRDVREKLTRSEILCESYKIDQEEVKDLKDLIKEAAEDIAEYGEYTSGHMRDGFAKLLKKLQEVE